MARRSFDVGDRVIFGEQGTQYRGRITEKLRQKRRIVTDSNRRFTVPVRRLKPSPDRVLILEGRLEKNLLSKRIYGPMWRTWLSAHKVDAQYERVHTAVDLRKFLQHHGRQVGTRFIHIGCHGCKPGGAGTAYLDLTFEKVVLLEQAEIFRGLRGKIIIFSSCEVGSDQKAIRAVREASEAKAVISYRLAIDDRYANLAEVMLYERLLESNVAPSKAVEDVWKALRVLGVRIEGHAPRTPVMVCTD